MPPSLETTPRGENPARDTARHDSTDLSGGSRQSVARPRCPEKDGGQRDQGKPAAELGMGSRAAFSHSAAMTA